MAPSLLLPLLSALASGATPPMNGYLPGAAPIVPGTGYAGMGPLYVNQDNTSRLGLHLQAGYDLATDWALSTTVATASTFDYSPGGTAGDLWALHDVAVRWQPYDQEFLSVAGFAAIGSMSNNDITDVWPTIGMAAEGGLRSFRLDYSAVVPVFLFDDLESIPEVIIGTLALLEFGASLRFADAHRVRLGKSALAMVLGYQYLQPTWYLDANIGYTPAEPWFHAYVHGGFRF